MTSREFVYWLQGLFELGEPKALDEKQTESVRRHLAMVFKHEIDPSAGTPEHQAELSALHEGLESLKQKVGQVEKTAGHDPHIVLRC